MDYRERFAGLSRDMLIGKAIYYAELTDVYERENKKLAGNVKGAEEVIEGLEKELTKTREEKDARINNLCDKIASKNGLIGTLRSQLDSAKNTIEALKNRNNDNNEITTDLELNNRKLQVRIQELEKQLKQAAEFGDICMDKIREMEMKNGKLNEEVKNYAELIKENDSLRNRNDHLAKVNNQLDYRVREMIELKDDLYTQIRNMEKRNHELAIERDEYKHAYEHARKEYDKLTPLKCRVDQLTAYKETMREAIRKLEAEKAELTTKLTDSDGIRKAVSEENDKLNRRTWELHRENLILEYEIKNLMETKLGVINSFNLDCEGEYLELMLTHDAGKSFMKNVNFFKEGTAIKVSDFVETEKPVTPKDLWKDGETVVEGFASGVKAKQPEEPVCKSVPCSTVIRKLENYLTDTDGTSIQVRLSEKASAYFEATRPHTIGEEIDIQDLQIKIPELLTIEESVHDFVAKRMNFLIRLLVSTSRSHV